MSETPSDEDSSAIGIFSNVEAAEATAAWFAILIVAATITLPEEILSSTSLGLTLNTVDNFFWNARSAAASKSSTFPSKRKSTESAGVA